MASAVVALGESRYVLYRLRLIHTRALPFSRSVAMITEAPVIAPRPQALQVNPLAAALSSAGSKKVQAQQVAEESLRSGCAELVRWFALQTLPRSRSWIFK